MRSLRTWLALGLVAGIVVPACAGLVAWVAAGPWQKQHELARRDDAVRLVENATHVSPALADRLAAMGVEAELAPALGKLAPGAKPEDVKRKMITELITTPGLRAVLDAPDGKQRLQAEFTDYHVTSGVLDATLWIPHESSTRRWAVALGAAAVALIAVLLAAVALLSRWVLRPLATLARDADRIAGGELAVEPVRTRAREVAQVGDAMSGMAGALETALGASAAAEHDRRFLISAIAHDLRTPLFTLRGSLEAIERGIGDTGALERAQRKADHLDRLVGDLFAFSRAEYAHEAYEREPVDLAEIARRAVETVAPAGARAEAPPAVANGHRRAEREPASPTAAEARSAAPNGHQRAEREPASPTAAEVPSAAVKGDRRAPASSAAAEVPPSPPAGALSQSSRAPSPAAGDDASVRVDLVAPVPAPVLGDAVALERVLTNVLDNAVRHARSSVRVEVGEDAVVVVDDGPGFAEADLPHVFEPLFRGDRARSGGGAGLGLAIARRLARAHGGDVVAGNDAAGGARVTVSFA